MLSREKMANQTLGIVQTGKEHKRKNITSYSRNVLHSRVGCSTPRAGPAVLNSLDEKKIISWIRKDVEKGNRNCKRNRTTSHEKTFYWLRRGMTERVCGCGCNVVSTMEKVNKEQNYSLFSPQMRTWGHKMNLFFSVTQFLNKKG